MFCLLIFDLDMLTIDQIQTVVADYFRDKPVKKVWLFGSYARGEESEESDVDLLVELDYAQKIGWAFYGWPDELKEKFNMPKVDIVSVGGLSRYIGPYILAERKLIYEEDTRHRAA